ncbi:MAG: hypothetical protein KKB95_00500 [Gammaproteobacteria bacterium]|nr:hypothetical protein [Gammaproteobacteria bacterium]MBU1350350.1 hypothetical protein [Gammaproteobacteria bacterium]MBU1505134.1 hypothetical protein [Gammaproteobacteria bacterium]MBU1817862.1 hypothetical protein [Gammaproteobacteria bacterium]MBU2122008.1 hypothetical protein [Gammaproteobacteria bacterium]
MSDATQSEPVHSPVALSHYRRLFGVGNGSLRDEYVKTASKKQWSDAESREWARMAETHRMVLMLLAGLDGDLGALAQRGWRELPEPERERVKAEARFARREFMRLHAMTGRW